MSQFITLDHAKQIAATINAFAPSGGAPLIGGGILPVTDDRNTSGIFLYSWGGPYPYPSPEPGQPLTALPYYFRYRNGNIENNAGICGDIITFYPTRWSVMLYNSTPPMDPPSFPI